MSTLSRRVQVGLIVVNLAFWGAIFAYVARTDPSDVHVADRLADPVFPAEAEDVCAASLADIRALGRDPIADSPDERAETVDLTNDVLRAMVRDLRALPPPPDPEQASWVAQWLDDWETHLDDRQAWADGLRAGRDVAFAETPRGTEQISEVIDGFAAVNNMPSCETTHDV